VQRRFLPSAAEIINHDERSVGIWSVTPVKARVKDQECFMSQEHWATLTITRPELRACSRRWRRPRLTPSANLQPALVRSSSVCRASMSPARAVGLQSNGPCRPKRRPISDEASAREPGLVQVGRPTHRIL